MTAGIEQHLKAKLLPAGFIPAAEEAINILLEHGWDAADHLVTVQPGVTRIESALQVDGGGQLIRVIDLVKALELLPLLPPELNWIERHPSWRS